MFLSSTARGNALPVDAVRHFSDRIDVLLPAFLTSTQLARHSKILVAALHGGIFGE